MKSGNKPGFKNMGSSPALNMKDGSYKQSFESPAKLRPSYIDGDMVSDADANLEDAKNTYKASMGEETTEVTRKGQSKVKKIKADAKARKPGAKEKDALSLLDKDEIKEAEKYQMDPKNRAEQTKSWELNNPGYKLVDGKKVKKTSPAKQRLTKGGEGKDQNKIFDNKGKHIGNYVNGKKVMLSTTSAHGQLGDAKREFEQDKKNAAKMLKKKSPAKQTKFPNAPKALKRKQKDFVPAYPGADYSKEDIAKMTEKQKAKSIDGYTPKKVPGKIIKKTTPPGRIIKKKSPAKQVKRSGLGPRASFGGVKNPELIKDKKKPFSKKVMVDGKKVDAVHNGKIVKGNWQAHQFRK